MLRLTPSVRAGAARKLVLASSVASGALLALLGFVYYAFDSQLALAQAADSFSDVFTSIALLVSIRVAAAPADEGHPAGHQRAEPVAALVAAVMAGVLAVEVLRAAALAILNREEARLEWALAVAFAAKIAVKTVIAWRARARAGERKSPALDALHVDARNDVAVCSLALAGFFAARFGWGGLDAWLAIPVATWIGWSGFDLARQNVELLMGAAPPGQRRAELAAIAAGVSGVRSVHDLIAQHHGVELDVHVHVVVDPSLNVRQAHDIGQVVESRLCAEPDVYRAVVHIDVE